jgi:hypothetical protein
MKNINIIVSLKRLIFLMVFLFTSQIGVAIAENVPIIHIDPTTHTFPAVFEGETLSHDFTVMNKGSADLVIKDVTHQ